MAILSFTCVPEAYAQEINIETEENNATITSLQENCDTIKTTLRRIHTNDALLRVNMGQMYSGLSSQFMARLNSRLTLNRINSTELVDITGRFENQRTEFASAYTNYESALSSLIGIDCRSQPVKFYAALLNARDERANLAGTVQSMNGYIRDYQVGVEKMQQSLAEGQGVDGN